MNNSVFGKTIENIRNHKDMKLLTSLRKYGKYVIKPNLWVSFLKELFAVETGAIETKMNKLVYLGQKIIHLSKELI